MNDKPTNFGKLTDIDLAKAILNTGHAVSVDGAPLIRNANSIEKRLAEALLVAEKKT